jgi:hypothetical protein
VEYFSVKTKYKLVEEPIIFVLEAIAVKIAYRIWAAKLKEKTTTTFVDNRSALGALQKGYSSSYPLAEIVADFWQTSENLKVATWWEYVHSEDNCADDPSRGVWTLLEKWNAKRIEVELTQEEEDWVADALFLHYESLANNPSSPLHKNKVLKEEIIARRKLARATETKPHQCNIKFEFTKLLADCQVACPPKRYVKKAKESESKSKCDPDDIENVISDDDNPIFF